MLKMCLSGCSFCALLWHSILFPDDAKYWMPGIIPFNKCVCDFYHIQAVCSVLLDMKDYQMVYLAVSRGRTEVRFYPLHGRKWSLTDWQGDFLSAQWLEAQKSLLLHLMIAQTPPVLSHCRLLIQESTWESPAAPSTLPPSSHLYATEGLHPRVPQSPLLVGKVKTIPVYFWIRSSLFVR